MRLLLDTHVLVALLERRLDRIPNPVQPLLLEEGNVRVVSVASLRELAIKSRLGKLPISVPLAEWPDAIRQLGLTLLAIEDRHVLFQVDPQPDTKDPFDRLFLGICAVEDLRLVTLDQRLAVHPLARRPVPEMK